MKLKINTLVLSIVCLSTVYTLNLMAAPQESTPVVQWKNVPKGKSAPESSETKMKRVLADPNLSPEQKGAKISEIKRAGAKVGPAAVKQAAPPNSTANPSGPPALSKQDVEGQKKAAAAQKSRPSVVDTSPGTTKPAQPKSEKKISGGKAIVAAGKAVKKAYLEKKNVVKQLQSVGAGGPANLKADARVKIKAVPKAVARSVQKTASRAIKTGGKVGRSVQSAGRSAVKAVRNIRPLKIK